VVKVCWKSPQNSTSLIVFNPEFALMNEFKMESEIFTLFAKDGGSIQVFHDDFVKTEYGRSWVENKTKMEDSKIEQTFDFSTQALLCIFHECLPFNVQESDFLQCWYFFNPSRLSVIRIIINDILIYDSTTGFSWFNLNTDFSDFDSFDVSINITETNSIDFLSNFNELIKMFCEIVSQESADWLILFLSLEKGQLMLSDDTESWMQRICDNFHYDWLDRLYADPIATCLHKMCFDCFTTESLLIFANCLNQHSDPSSRVQNNIDRNISVVMKSKPLFDALLHVNDDFILYANILHPEQDLELLNSIVGYHIGLVLLKLQIKIVNVNILQSFLKSPNIQSINDHMKKQISHHFIEQLMERHKEMSCIEFGRFVKYFADSGFKYHLCHNITKRLKGDCSSSTEFILRFLFSKIF
jgi:hypothetical protein